MPGNREVIASALFGLVSPAASAVVGLITSSRKLRHFDDVTPQEMPALFQAQGNETQERKNFDIPAKRTMHFALYLYTADAQQPAVIPSTQINNMVDAIETVLLPSPVTGKQTLGGLVAHTWIEGIIEVFECVTDDGKSIAIIPIAVLMP